MERSYLSKQKIVFEFCGDESIKKRKFELFCRKQFFLFQIEQLNLQGKIDTQMAKIETWIDDNLQLLYSNKFPCEKVMVYRKMQKYKVELLKHSL